MNYLAANVVGKMRSLARRLRARRARVFGQKAGAVASSWSTTQTRSAIRGPITSNPDTANSTVTIPSRRALEQRCDLARGERRHCESDDANIANPAFLSLASFSPAVSLWRQWPETDVAAPGVSIQSAGMGTG
jgi:hypothetical protein